MKKLIAIPERIIPEGFGPVAAPFRLVGYDRRVVPIFRKSGLCRIKSERPSRPSDLTSYRSGAGNVYKPCEKPLNRFYHLLTLLFIERDLYSLWMNRTPVVSDRHDPDEIFTVLELNFSAPSGAERKKR